MEIQVKLVLRVLTVCPSEGSKWFQMGKVWVYSLRQILPGGRWETVRVGGVGAKCLGKKRQEGNKDN